MKKLPKFLLCHNVQAAPASMWVLHTQSPRFIAEVLLTNHVELLELQKTEGFVYKSQHFSMGAQTQVDGQLYAIIVREILDDLNIKIVDGIGSGGIMSRMGDWFHSYMKANYD